MHPVFLFSLAAGLLFAVGSIFDKFILENKMQNSTSFFFMQSFLAMALFPTISILIFGLQFPTFFTMFLILFTAIAANIGFFIYFFLVKNYNLSSVGPLAQTKLLFAIPLAFIFLSEFYGLKEFGLMALIFAGAVLTTYSKQLSLKKLLLNNRLLLLAIFMSLSWALADVPVKVIVAEIAASSFMAWRYILTLPVIAIFAIFLFNGTAKKDFVQKFRRTIPFAFTASLIGFTGMMLLFSAYEFSYTIPSALVLSQAAFVFALAFIISRIKSTLIAENEPLKVYAVRFLGVLLIISSIYFLITGNLVF